MTIFIFGELEKVLRDT